MTQEKVREILVKHKMWIDKEDGGECADLRGADLRGVDLSGEDLRHADLSHVDLSHATCIHVDLSYAILRDVDFSHATISDVDLSYADLSGAKGLLSAADFLKQHFERTDTGYIAYKTFGAHYIPPKNWEIVPGAELTETVNPDRCTECGSGINVAPLKWVKKRYQFKRPIWKVLIKWEWLPGVVVPYMTDGKIRCEKVQLIGTVKEDKNGSMDSMGG